MRKHLFTLACAALLGAPASAVTIDPFDAAQSLSAPDGSDAAATVSDPGILGGGRDIYLSEQGDGAVNVANGVLSYSINQTVLMQNGFGISWDGDSFDGPGGRGLITSGFWTANSYDFSPVPRPEDLTEGGTINAFALRFASWDFGPGVTILAVAWSPFAAGCPIPNCASEASVSLSGSRNSPTTILLPFADFSGQDPVDFTEIGALTLFIYGYGPHSAQLDSYATTFVPEPSTALLLACGLVALGVRRRLA